MNYLGLTAAAKYLGVGKMTVWRWAKSGKLHPVKFIFFYRPKRMLFKEKDLRKIKS